MGFKYFIATIIIISLLTMCGSAKVDTLDLNGWTVEFDLNASNFHHTISEPVKYEIQESQGERVTIRSEVPSYPEHWMIEMAVVNREMPKAFNPLQEVERISNILRAIGYYSRPDLDDNQIFQWQEVSISGFDGVDIVSYINLDGYVSEVHWINIAADDFTTYSVACSNLPEDIWDRFMSSSRIYKGQRTYSRKPIR